MAEQYTDKECLDALRKAKKELGHSPSRKEYRDLNIKPDDSTIRRRFDGWNGAKEKAGLKKLEKGDRINNEVDQKPDYVDLPEEISWEKDLNPRQRWYYKNKEQEKERSKKRKKRIKKWYKSSKKSEECKECGEKRVEALEYHHRNPEDKKMSVTDMVRQKYSIPKIKEEMKKCDVLCANCHRVKHADLV